MQDIIGQISDLMIDKKEVTDKDSKCKERLNVRKKLVETLTDRQVDLLVNYENVIYEQVASIEDSAFRRGFKIGVKLIKEVYKGD